MVRLCNKIRVVLSLIWPSNYVDSSHRHGLNAGEDNSLLQSIAVIDRRWLYHYNIYKQYHIGHTSRTDFNSCFFPPSLSPPLSPFRSLPPHYPSLPSLCPSRLPLSLPPSSLSLSPLALSLPPSLSHSFHPHSPSLPSLCLSPSLPLSLSLSYPTARPMLQADVGMPSS